MPLVLALVDGCSDEAEASTATTTTTMAGLKGKRRVRENGRRHPYEGASILGAAGRSISSMARLGAQQAAAATSIGHDETTTKLQKKA